MARAFTPKVLTANDLMSGDVIYRAPDGTWVSDHASAQLFLDQGEADAALADAVAQPHQIVGPYLADANASDHGPTPVHFREVFRSRGPSNYAHGKQETAHV